MKVLITARVFADVGQAALDAMRDAGCELIMPEKTGPLFAADLLPQLVGVDAVLASSDQYDAAVLASEEARQLKIISRWGVGYDSIDIAAATRQGIIAAYTPGFLNEAVADYTWALLLSIARNTHLAHKAVENNTWPCIWGHDISGKTLGIIGYGRIGQAVAKRGMGFDLKILACDPVAATAGVSAEFVSLDELLSRSDFVCLHAAMTPENKGLIGEAQLRKMKPTSYLINTARGGLIQEPALARALNEGWIAGAALDVFQKEPLGEDHVFRSTKNLLLSPHLASFGRETGDCVSMVAAQAIIAVCQGRKAEFNVNPEVYNSPALRMKLLQP